MRTTLGPRGMDKLIVDNKGSSIISNDGATILAHLNVAHPAAKALVDISRSQDAEVRGVFLGVVSLFLSFLFLFCSLDQFFFPFLEFLF